MYKEMVLVDLVIAKKTSDSTVARESSFIKAEEVKRQE